MQNIFKKDLLTTILPKNYNKILAISGPTNDKDRTGNSENIGLRECFFWVEDGNSTFYVDEKGVEYKVKQ